MNLGLAETECRGGGCLHQRLPPPCVCLIRRLDLKRVSLVLRTDPSEQEKSPGANERVLGPSAFLSFTLWSYHAVSSEPEPHLGQSLPPTPRLRITCQVAQTKTISVLP